MRRYGFGAYFTVLPGSEWSAIMLTYGFPLSVIGFALKVQLPTSHCLLLILIEFVFLVYVGSEVS